MSASVEMVCEQIFKNMVLFGYDYSDTQDIVLIGNDMEKEL